MLASRQGWSEKSSSRRNGDMGWKRETLELLVRAASAVGTTASECPANPRSIFVLRNNDLGDVLVATPLFAALRRRYPRTRLVAGVGRWAVPILQGNPNVDAVLPVNAPWHNAQVRPQGLVQAAKYIFGSSEGRRLAEEKFEVGVDYLGSALGALLLVRAGIPFRVGVRGYAGGHSAMQGCVDFDERMHVAATGLQLAALLGADEMPEPRPQLFLSERSACVGCVVIAPGGGYRRKCWPVDHFVEIARRMPFPMVVIGGPGDAEAGARLAAVGTQVIDLTGKLSLRESFAVIAESRLVLANSSMAMHAAAAFRRPCVVMLGEEFANAEQHAMQWGYPETRVLGRDSEHDGPWSPDEVWPYIAEILSSP